MKNLTDRKLLITAIVSAALYGLILFDSAMGSVVTDIFPAWSQWGLWLIFSLHGVPMLCIQLLLCRRLGCRWLSFLPLILLFAVAGALFILMSTATGWDSLGWFILLCLCAAPAVGVVLAWIIWTIARRRT